MVNTTNAHDRKVTLGFKAGNVVQEFCWDEDVNDDLREQIVTLTGNELADEDFNEVADGALIWWRDDDGSVDDLSDLLVDALGNLDAGGLIWVFTPKAGKPNGISAQDIEEAASTAGLITTTSVVRGDWSGLCVEVHSRR